MKYSCSVTQTKTRNDSFFAEIDTVVTSELSSANRTIFIEYPPTIALTSPPDGNWSKYKRLDLNFTVSSAFGELISVSPFPCQIWTNESGLWSFKAAMTVENNTVKQQGVDLPEKAGIKWGVKCQESSDGNVFNFTVNRTINIDTIDPLVSVSADNEAMGGGVGNFSNGTVAILYTVSDANIQAIDVFFGSDFSVANFTNLSIESGDHSFRVNYSQIDGRYNISVRVNDSTGRIIESENITIIVDLTYPSLIDVNNFTTPGSWCSKRNLNWSTNETTNVTFYIDTDTEVTDGTIYNNSTFSTIHHFEFDFGVNSEITHYFNLTSCDEAGNCNTSNQRTFQTPASGCTGWSQYAIYDNKINMSSVANQSGADLVYVWNATNQNWIFFTQGLSSNQAVIIGRNTQFHVAHLFENTNDTWFRNTTNLGNYKYNITSENNFLNVPTDYSFGNLTESFMNLSRVLPGVIGNNSGNSLPNGTENVFGPFNLTAFAGYNNTITSQNYVNHIFNFTWSNDTLLEPCPNRENKDTCMETFWVGSGFNITWNGTTTVENWTI